MADPKTISIDQGVAHALGYGEASIAVTYLGQAAVTLLHVPQPLPVDFPQPKLNNRIDELVYAKLKSLGIPPSELATDQDFQRRVYLDAIGVLPTAKEAREFLADRSPEKRAKLIDRLLHRDEYADFWALKWSDLLRIRASIRSVSGPRPSRSTINGCTTASLRTSLTTNSLPSS